MRNIVFLALLAFVGCATAPQYKTAAPAVTSRTRPTYAGYMGMVFEELHDGSLVGVDFVKSPYTPNHMACDVNNSVSVGHVSWTKGHYPRAFCLPLVKPPVGNLTLVAVVNHGLGDSGFVAVAVEFWRHPKIDMEEMRNPIFGAKVLGHADDESSCIRMGKATIKSSLAAHKIRHPLTISCIAVPPPVVKDIPKNGTAV